MLVSPFWYRLTRVVPDKGPLNGCVCVCVCVCVSRSVVLCPGDTGVCCVQKWTQNCDRRHTIYDTIRRTCAQETDASSQLDLPRGIKDKKNSKLQERADGTSLSSESSWSAAAATASEAVPPVFVLVVVVVGLVDRLS